jgi:hypothetical protein
MNLSPVSAIGDMVAPVVLITMCTFLANALLASAVTTSQWVLALERERHGLLRGTHGELLEDDSVPPADRQRLTQINDETQRIALRIQRIREAVLIIWIAIALLVLSIAAISVAVTAHSQAFAFTALALVLAGVAGFFGAIAFAIVPMASSAAAVIPWPKRTRVPG